MKLKYVGHKALVTVTLPVGARGKLIKSKIDFPRDVAVEVDDSDAEKILLVNPSGNYQKVDGKIKEKPIEVAATLEIKEEAPVYEEKEEVKTPKKFGRQKKA